MVLTSWKSIAQYMGTGVRTIQRWTTERGFPVRGDGSGYKRIVVAATDEIDAWVRAQALHVGKKEEQGEQEIEALRQEFSALQAGMESLLPQIANPKRIADTRAKFTATLSNVVRLNVQLSNLLKKKSDGLSSQARRTRAIRAGENVPIQLLAETPGKKNRKPSGRPRDADGADAQSD